jgi:diaminopimelate epimerase
MSDLRERLGGLPRRFTKMAGAGNDFLVFPGPVSVGVRETDTIRRLCRRGAGVGADGVLVVHRDDGSGHVVVDYYNADGGAARFCANGTRCTARFAKLTGLAGDEQTVDTGWGALGATVRPDGNVTLHLPEPVAIGGHVATFDGGSNLLEAEGTSCEVGVPHLIVFTAEGVAVETLDVVALGPPLRRHPALADGANVTFVSAREGSRISARSYERGVEAETLSCGSGVVAAAIVAGARLGIEPPVSVTTRSGTTLVVDFRLEGSVARDVTLTGDARVVFEGVLSEEAV